MNFVLDAKHKSSHTRGMNKLPLEKRAQILAMLCEGSSMRSISRLTGVSINTVTKLLVDAGRACAEFHDEAVRNVKAERVQCDEIWSFNYAKANHVLSAKAAPERAGDVWTWTALDADSKLIISWLAGPRVKDAARAFMWDLSMRLGTSPVQLTTDGLKAYVDAVWEHFGESVDFAQLVKIYGPAPDGQRRYSPPECLGAIKTPVFGNPDPDYISTSFVERQNLTMRMQMRRFTRLTNAFSKKFENHCHALAIYFVWYNWMRIHKTLRVTPAMAAGLTDKLMEWSDVVAMINNRELETKIRLAEKTAVISGGKH
jgi:IS1 family transposase